MPSPRPTRTAAPEHRPLPRRALMAGAAWSVPVVALGSAAPAFAASFPCDQDTLWNAQSQGRTLSGGILPLDLDTIAALEGGVADTTPDLVEDGVNGDPLSVTALDALTVNLTGTAQALSTILDLNTSTGALNQSAYANQSGAAWGGSGAVDATGAINTANAGPDAPALATLDLQTVLQAAEDRLGVGTNDALSDLIASVANLRLIIGAAAGIAASDAGCDPAIERDYLLAYLRTSLESPTVTALSSALRTFAGANTTITLDAGSLLNSITSLLPTNLTNLQAVLSVTLNTAAITGTLPTASGSALQLDLTNTSGDGQVTVDLGAVLGYPSTGLNGLDPNTRLFADAPAPTPSVTTIVDEWLNALLSDLVTVNLTVSANVTLLGVPLTSVDVLKIENATLASIADGTATIQLLSVTVLGQSIQIIPDLTGPNRDGILSALLDTVTTQVKDLLSADGGVNAALGAVNDLLADLFDVLEDVLVLKINAQNDSTGTPPDRWSSIPTGQYDVAALQVGLVGMLDLLDLFLARGSVGVNTPR